MKKILHLCLGVWVFSAGATMAQITKLQTFRNNKSAAIGVFQGIAFREAGFSGLFAIPGTNGKEFWTVSDRGVNIDATNINPSGCSNAYDKMYAFPTYAPKIHRVRLIGDSIQILQTISIKRPNGTGATGLLNPTGLGSLATEYAQFDTLVTCSNFANKTATKDIWGIDSEGIAVDKDGNFWVCEEGGPTIWKLDPNGKVLKRFTPYANLVNAEPEDVLIDTVFKYRKNNRGFEGLAITPNGKVYAMIQSPILYPTQNAGESTRIHRLLEIDPTNNTSKVYAYLNEGPQGNIRYRDWKIGDLSAINDTTFLVIEAGLRNGTDSRKIYRISIAGASTVSSGLVYTGNKSLEQLVDATTLGINGITPVKKTLFLDLLANGWPVELEKTEGLAIINDSTIAVGNDNDYGQVSPSANGLATPTTIVSHIITYELKGANKLVNFVPSALTLTQGITGPSSSKAPYLVPLTGGVKIKSIITSGDATPNGYKFPGTPDGTGAFDNGDGTFTLIANHEFQPTDGVVRAHGSKGSLVSKLIINKSDLSVVSGADLIQNVNLWNGSGYTTYNTLNPSTLAAFGRFCSANLAAPSAFFNTVSGLGTLERIFTNGEEIGNEGRALAHIVTGTNAGSSYELPALGKFSIENLVANPKPSDKTIVVGMDDSTPGQVYVYIGNKTNNGIEIERAGLTNGKLYGVSVSGLLFEANTTPGVGAGFPFNLADLGYVSTLTGTQLNNLSNNIGVTNFLRPEDGDWDPSNPNDFYFNTTNAVNAPSRTWRLRFVDINNPELGGTATAVLDGTEGQQMLDNMTPDQYGNLILVEDVGNNTILGKVLQYNIHSDKLKSLAQHNPYLFAGGTANPSFITQDEEASGPIDVENILGKGWFIIVDQIHNKIPGEVVEGGQIVAFFNPDTYKAIKGAVAGPSSSKEPYLVPLAAGVKIKSIITAGDTARNGYKMPGTPDGSGAFDNGDGTFTFITNHEFQPTDGVVRAHGAKGSLVSKWIINKSDLSVVAGADLIQNVNLWNGTGYTTYNSINPSTLTAFGRFCSANLAAPSAFYNTVSGLGTLERIFTNGEEIGNEGRGFAHIVTGSNAGTSFELPALGKFSIENLVASPKPSDKTIVVGMDDSTPGQVYFYVGNKTNTGIEIERAGLTNGKLYGVSVSGLLFEANTTPGVGNGFAFALADLGYVTSLTGTQLNSLSNNIGVTNFLRPEDGDWDPINPNDFYFNTTNAVNAPSRTWRLRFTDINNPELGGTATAVLDGTEGQQMLDNMTIDKYGNIILVEDVGNNAISGKVFQYSIANDQLKPLAQHNLSLFTGGTANPSFITQDEEASGPIDVENILGKGWFIIVDQIHNKIPGEVVEGGQIVAFFNPDTYIATTSGGVITVAETSNEAATNVSIYPNPTESDVTVSLVLEKDDHIVINVADIQGKSVQNVVDADFGKGNQNIAVKTSNLSSGIYIVEVSTSKGTSRTKVVVIR